MKKLLSLLAILLVAVGCTNEEKLLDEPVMRKSVTSVKASFEESAETRTHFLNDTKLTWDKGDVIQVFSDKQKNASPFTYQGDNVFSGEAVNYDETIYAFYNPAGNAVVDWETKTVQATFPNSLVHNPDGYADPTFMVARSGNNELKFMQTVSILKFSLTGTKHITKLTLAGNNGEVIAGVGIIDLSSDEPVVTFSGDGETSIVMQADVTLDEESATSFYFQLPETVLEAGFTLTLEGEDATTGDSFKVEKRLDNRFVPKRSHVYSFTSMDVDDAIINGDGPSENAQPYYVIDGNTLTFYYDDQMDERAGAQLGWWHDWVEDEDVVYAELTPSCRFYKPESTENMFFGYENLVSISGLEYLDTSKVTNMSGMFGFCFSLTNLDLSELDTSKVTNMSYMFYSCSSLTNLDVSGFDTSKVMDMHWMFIGCSSLTSLDVSGFDTSNVAEMYSMFSDCSSLKTIYGGNWNYIDDSWDMFSGCNNLVGGQGSKLGNNNVYYDGRSAHIDGGPSNPGLFTAKADGPSGNTQPYYVIDGNTLTFYYDDQMDKRAGAQSGWLHGEIFDENVVYAELTPSCRFYKPESTNSMFYGYEKLVSISGLEYLDTSNVTDMYSMFEGCSSLTSLDLSGFVTSNVTDMYSMFGFCSSLTSLDVSGFDTSKVTDMYGMFGFCSSLTSLDVSGFDTSKVTNMMVMFAGCSSLTSLDVSGFDTSKVTDMPAMFRDCSSLETIYGGNWNYINSSKDMFYGCNNLVGGQGSRLGNNVFRDSRSAHIDGGSSNPGLFTAKADGPSENAQPYYVIDGNTLTFYYDDQMDKRAGAQPGWLHGEIYNENVVYAVLTPSCKFYKPESTKYMFFGYKNVVNISGLEYLDTSEVTNMEAMFADCFSLTSLDVSGFDTSNVTKMNTMFIDCISLTSLDVSRFDTSKVTDMNGMFGKCSSLTSLDVSKFNTSKVTDMSAMFAGCSSLTSLDVSGFKTSKVTRMDVMFNGCTSLRSLDISGFDTSKVTNMWYMFGNCSSLTSLDVNGFDTSNVTDMDKMFNGCSSLKTIYGGNWNYIDDSEDMFRGCDNLVGGQGSKLGDDNVYVDGRSAHIDGGPYNPGLFTQKP